MEIAPSVEIDSYSEDGPVKIQIGSSVTSTLNLTRKQWFFSLLAATKVMIYIEFIQ